jgi:hypothetical protein
MAYGTAQDETTTERARLYAEKGVTQEEVRQSGATEREMMKTPGAFSYSGTPGQFRRTPNDKGADVQAFSKASLAGKRLGDESSYGGQAPLSQGEIAQSESRVGQGQQDFAKPIQVIRRMTSTYQGPQAGEEFASPGQAAQAFRRDDGGDFVPEGGAKLALQHQQKLDEIAAQGKSQEASMAGDLMTRKKNSESFMNRIQSDPRFYKETPEGLQPVIPGLGQLLLGFKAMGEADPEKAFHAFAERATRHIDEAIHINDQGITKAIENLTKAGYTLKPGQKAWLAMPQANPEEEKKRRDTILQWVNPTAIPGQAGAAGQPSAQAQPSPLSTRGIDIQSLQNRVGGDMGQPKPLAPPSATFLRPDQMGALTDQFERQAAEKNKLSALSRETEDRLRASY